MPISVLMPALELAQETGKVLRWLKAPGDRVTKGEPLVEIETDKITTEIEAPASGVLGEVSAREGEDVQVGRPIAVIVETADAPFPAAAGVPERRDAGASPVGAPAAPSGPTRDVPPASGRSGRESSAEALKASPLARKLAAERGVDLALVRTATGRIEKADVLAYVERRQAGSAAGATAARRTAASPKARRLAAERGLELGALRGSGPDGAVLAVDVAAAEWARPELAGATAAGRAPAAAATEPAAPTARAAGAGVGTVWRIMAERMTASWTSAPHFYLVREVAVGRLVTWRERASKQTGARLTYTDLLVKLVAAVLRDHPEVNGSWRDGALVHNADINLGLAVAIEAGLVVPVLHRADTLDLAEIATRRDDLVTRAQAGKLRAADIQGGTFTISNLGMYGVDAFNAIVNPPQAAILAVGRIADRVVALGGQAVVEPTMVLTLSCDHRAVDGARAARFLGALADLVEEPLALLA